MTKKQSYILLFPFIVVAYVLFAGELGCADFVSVLFQVILGGITVLALFVVSELISELNDQRPHITYLLKEGFIQHTVTKDNELVIKTDGCPWPLDVTNDGKKAYITYLDRPYQRVVLTPESIVDDF